MPSVPFSRRDDLYRLMQHLGISRAHLVGCSLGGEIILDFALEHSEMVSSLVVISSVPSGFEMQGVPPQNLLAMLAALEQQDLASASEFQMRLSIDGPFRQPGQVKPNVREKAAEMNRIAFANGTMAVLDAVPLSPPAVARLHEIHVPTLVMAGALDDPEILRAADVMTDTIPHARKALIADSAHLPNMEQPEAFNQVIIDFLKKVR